MWSNPQFSKINCEWGLGPLYKAYIRVRTYIEKPPFSRTLVTSGLNYYLKIGDGVMGILHGVMGILHGVMGILLANCFLELSTIFYELSTGLFLSYQQFF